jgi:NADH-quinone oxidoreductase subunit M
VWRIAVAEDLLHCEFPLPLLSLNLLWPLVGALALLLLPLRARRVVPICANIFFGLGLLLALPLWSGFNAARAGEFQFVERYAWIPTIGAEYYLAVDGFALLLVLLCSLTGLLASLCSWSAIQERQREFYLMLMLMQFTVIGAFVARDALLFFFFFEFSLVPMFFLIDIWGGANSRNAAMKFLVYTLAGSVLLLLGLVALWVGHGRATGNFTMSMDTLSAWRPSAQMQFWLFWAFFAGFAVKVPMFPFHTWLPDAHTEAPTAGSLYLAAIMLKIGTYGMMRFSLPMFPDAVRDPMVAGTVGLLSLIAILYGALLCIMQRDWKRLIACSSISHMGYCTAGMFTFHSVGIQGSMLQQINHGVSTGLLFVLAGMAYERRHSRYIADYRNLFEVAPRFSIVFLLAALSSMGMPPLNGFVAEVAILQGTAAMSGVWTLVCVLGIGLAAAYLIWMYQRISFRNPQEDITMEFADLNLRELAVVAPLTLLIFVLGIGAEPFFHRLAGPADLILQRLR